MHSLTAKHFPLNKIPRNNNPKKYVDRLYNMCINKPLGLPIRGEGKPKIPYPNDSDWDGLDLPWMAYGYGVAMTPLQTLTFYNAIANNGEKYKCHRRTCI